MDKEHGAHVIWLVNLNTSCMGRSRVSEVEEERQEAGRGGSVFGGRTGTDRAKGAVLRRWPGSACGAWLVALDLRPAACARRSAWFLGGWRRLPGATLSEFSLLTPLSLGHTHTVSKRTMPLPDHWTCHILTTDVMGP